MGIPSIESAQRASPYWLLVAVVCLVPAVLDAFKSYINSKLYGNGATDWGDVIFAGSEWLFLGALMPITYILGRRYPLLQRRDSIVRMTAIHAAGAIVLCVGWATLGVLLGLLLKRYPAQGNLPSAYISWILTSLPWSVFMYFTMLGCIYAFTYYAEARERETQQARLRAQLAEAKLGALRMQLHPHFLFNSLNAITVLIRDHNTRDASRMLELLSSLLRQVLQSETRQEITLNEELRFVEQYLAIEQVRFSDRLQVKWSIDPQVLDALVPGFILQPLVENAVRHGVAKRSKAGTIEVWARTEDSDRLVLGVEDNGPGYQPESATEGVGLANTRARLETLFGDAGQLELLPAEGGGTMALLRFPLRKSKD